MMTHHTFRHFKRSNIRQNYSLKLKSSSSNSRCNLRFVRDAPASTHLPLLVQ